MRLGLTSGGFAILRLLRDRILPGLGKCWRYEVAATEAVGVATARVLNRYPI